VAKKLTPASPFWIAGTIIGVVVLALIATLIWYFLRFGKVP
jgi:hypothetical protein